MKGHVNYFYGMGRTVYWNAFSISGLSIEMLNYVVNVSRGNKGYEYRGQAVSYNYVAE